MAMNRKGILFTFLAILLSALFITLYSARIEPAIDQNGDLITTRVHRLNTAARDLEAYMGDALEASSASALDSITRRLGETKTAIPSSDFQAIFAQCVVSPRQECPGTELPRMENYTRYARTAMNDIGISLTTNVNNITIAQNYPFDIDIEMNMSVYIEDKGYASIRRGMTVHRVLIINGLPDPLYAIHANLSFVKNATINPNPALYDINWTLNQVKEFIGKGQYRYSTSAPSYLQRFSDDFTPSGCCGMESLIDPSNLKNPTVEIRTKYNNWSFVDWKFFKKKEYAVTYCIIGLSAPTFPPATIPYPEFRLDPFSLAEYNRPSIDWVAPTAGQCPT